MGPIPKIEFGVLGVLATTIGVFWSNVRGMFARVSSFVIVQTVIDSGYAGQAFTDYCWRHLKPSRFGIRTFSGLREFYKPGNRYCIVPQERTGDALTFFDGWKPLFVSDVKNGGDNNMHTSGKVKVSYLRGTFDIEKMFVQGVVEFDKNNMESSETHSRYHVRKIFGTAMMPPGMYSGSDGNSESDEKAPIQASGDTAGTRILHYDPKDLGTPKEKKPFINLAYSKAIEEFETEVIRWKDSEKWHKEKGLPWRFGAGLFGPPGTGKTSFVRAIGQQLDMPIHIYDLTSMDNKELSKYWKKTLACAPCIVLFEDLDRIFDKDKNIIRTKDGKGVTLDALLNCINGIESADGILTFVTANNMKKIDPALGVPDGKGKSTRPGRLDRAVMFGALTEEGRQKIAERILSDCPEVIAETVKAGSKETGAQFESRCGKIALAHKWGSPKIYGEVS